MANIDKKQKRWYSKSTFDSLDKTTIPIGTEIQVGGELGQADFDSDTNTKLNAVANKLDKTGGSITGSLTISQDLIVNGTTSTVESTSLKVADKLIYVAKDNTVALTTPAGLITPKYDGTNNGGIVYDNIGTAYVGDIALDSNGNVDVNNSDLQPIATRDDDGNLTDGNLISWDATNNKLVDSGKNSASFATATHTHNYAGSSSAGGAATSANKLTTERKISLGTGVTGTATSFDGSSDITIPVTAIKESYLSWGGKDFSNGFSPMDAALIEDLSANRLAGLPSSKVTFERSSDAGSTWTTYDSNPDIVTSSGNASNANTVDSKSADNWHRITINVEGSVYCVLRKIAIFLGTNGATGCECILETGDYSSTTVWTTQKTVSVNGWTGWNIINTDLTIGSPTYGKIKYIRLTFTQTGVSSSSGSNLNVTKIRFYSSVCWSGPSTLANTGHVYSYDGNLRVMFPNMVTAPRFDGNATKDGNGNTITSTYIKGLSVSGQTVTYTKGDGSTGTITTQDTKYTHPTSGVTAGTYKSVTVDNQGHVTAGTNPTTLSGYGITDAAKASDLSSHTGNKSNPHGVTKAQIGLGNVENKSSTTIRSEITKSNVTSALGYTPAGVNDLTELKVELNQKFIKDPNKTYLIFIGNEFPGNETAQFKASEGSTIDWGDGNVETFNTAPEGRGITTHTYAYSTADDYHLITISGGSGIPINAFKQVRIYKAIIGSYDCGDIGDSAFDGCGELEEVEFSTSSVNIGNSAFQDCSSLREIFLHDVSSIGDYAFSGCGLKKCVIDNETPPTMGTSSFDSTYSDFRIFVPRIAYDTYINDSGWLDYTSYTVFAPDNLDIEYKQDALSTEQMYAVNSGITAAKVSTYDGYSTSKQDKLYTAQLNAANSGITSSKVSTYDGYASKISTLEAKPGLDKVGTVTSIKMNGAAKNVDSNGSVDLGTVLTAHQDISGKQDKLTTAQLNAVNSGITSSKVSTYDGYATSISKKLTAPATPSAESAIILGTDGTVSTKALTSITGKTEVAVQGTAPTGTEVLWINPDGTSGGSGGSGSVGGKLYLHTINITLDSSGNKRLMFKIYSSSDTLFTAESLDYKGANIAYYIGDGNYGVIPAAIVSNRVMARAYGYSGEIDLADNIVSFTDTVTEV